MSEKLVESANTILVKRSENGFRLDSVHNRAGSDWNTKTVEEVAPSVGDMTKLFLTHLNPDQAQLFEIVEATLSFKRERILRVQAETDKKLNTELSNEAATDSAEFM